MTLNPFIYNPQQALAAGQSGFITDSGAYVVTITDAQFSTQPSGAKSMELSIETEEGRKAQYLHLYHEKKDGTANPYGLQLIHALMGCTGVRQLHPLGESERDGDADTHRKRSRITGILDECR
ncbi:hypothetical protein [Candidatus Williamhamiltonella defendens]|uniref:hypothetical protein n=1 Tax=Candidatus Williamhamiltonella defendens TaxID=138072 RepID=UPI00061898ED|nr:hypothetical protein [Candidatus Hamiltonella defensa]CED78510.1 Putative phage protein [Candidatus Hamiltonella defensa (Bemisia tabaci)]